jgi:hypothetical protein
MTHEEEIKQLKARIAELEKQAETNTPKTITTPDLPPSQNLKLARHGVIPAEVLKGPAYKPFATGPVPMDANGRIIDKSWERDEYRKVFVRRNRNGEPVEIVPMSAVCV